MSQSALPGTGKKVAIIGSGMLGSSWAMLFANAGYTISIYDVEQSQLDKAFTTMRENFEMLASNDLLEGEATIDERLSRISATIDFEHALTGAFYVQECVPENQALKQQIFKRLDASSAVTGNSQEKKVVLASSCSTMPMSMISSDLAHRDQTIIVHPVNPVFYLRVVEIIPAPFTDPEITNLARQVMLSVGRAPVVLRKEITGFAVNRFQYAIYSEAWHLVNDGILDPEEVDLVISEGLGPRYAFFGPWEVMVLNAPKGALHYCQLYSDACKRVQDTFKPPHTYEPSHPTTQRCVAAMDKRVPAGHLDDFRKLRDGFLQDVARAKAKRNKDGQLKKWKQD